MLLQCCSPHVNKFGKLSDVHRTGKGQFSLQSLRRAVPYNYGTTTLISHVHDQTTIQLYSFHMLEKEWSKYFNLGFSNMWIKNLHTNMLGFKEAEEWDQIANICCIMENGESKGVAEIYLLLYRLFNLYAVWFSSVTKLCQTLCDPMDCSRPSFPVHHQLLELAQTHVHQGGDAIQPSHPVGPFLSHLQSFPASESF